MDTREIRELAIKQHEIHAHNFQRIYESQNNQADTSSFLYGRKMLIEELKTVLSQMPPGAKVLDIGCGTAHLSKWIKDSGFEVYGIEPAENMYQLARANFPDIEIKKAVSSSIPYPDEFFDLIVAFEVLRYLDKADNAATLTEIRRVLKPNGRFFVTQVNLFSADFYVIFHHLKGLLCFLTGKSHHHCNFTTAGKQALATKQAGFRDVRTIGRMSGLTRMLLRLPRGTGKPLVRAIERRSTQRYDQPIKKNLAAHLIVIGQK